MTTSAFTVTLSVLGTNKIDLSAVNSWVSNIYKYRMCVLKESEYIVAKRFCVTKHKLLNFGINCKFYWTRVPAFT